MVFTGIEGPTYTEIKAMDFSEYNEFLEARLLWQSEWKPKQQVPKILIAHK